MRRQAAVRMAIAVAAAAVFAAPAAQGQVFNWFDPIVDISESATGSWTPVDVSANVPAGATGVMVEVKTEGSSDDEFAIRKNGSSDEWMWGPTTIKNDTHTWFMIGVDSNRIFEVKQGDSDIDMYLLGYTTAGVTFFDNAYDKSTSGAGWEDVDISTETGTDTAIAGIFIIQNTGSSQNWSIRMNGASDNRGSACGGSAGGDLRTNMSTLAIVGLDAGEICEICVESTEVKAYLVGYVTEGAVFFQEPIQKTIGTTYTDVDISSHLGTDDANGAFVQLWADFDDRHQTGIRKNGTSYDYDKWTSTQMGPVAVDGSYVFEAKTDDTDGMELWLYGYSVSDIARYRSIGTDTGTLYSTGNATIAQDAKVVTFGSGASLPANVGVGDELVIGSETFHIKTKDSATQVTVHSPATSSHTNSAYTIARAYNDIQSWEDARDGDLVGENRREVGVCYDDGDFTPTSEIQFEGSDNSDASRNMTLTVAEGQRHAGVAGAGVVIDGSGTGADAINVGEPCVRIEWVQITNFKNGSSADGIELDDTDPSAGSVVANVIIFNFDGAGRGVRIEDDVTLRNVIIYDGESGIRIQDGAAANLENLTVFDTGGDGISCASDSSISVRNTISVGNGTDIDIGGTVDYADYNMYQTASGFTAGANDQSPPADLDNLFVSIAAGSEDLHLEPSGHNALDTGLDLSSSFTTDIDGETRSAPWDLGADEGGVAVNYRSVGTDSSVIYQTGDASISAGATVVTFGGGASLPTNIGQGDELVIGAETFYIYSRDSATQVTVQTAAAAAHSSAAYTISRAYNTFQAWEDDRDGDLVGENRREVAVAYNDSAFTAGATIDDSTTDAGHYMMITVAEGQRHSGVAGTGARIDAQGTSADVIVLSDEYVRIEWLALTNFDGSSSADGIVTTLNNGANAYVSHVLMYDYLPGTGVHLFADGTVRNSIFYNGREAITVQDVGVTIESVTVYNMGADGVDVDGGGPVTVRNTIVLGSVNSDFDIEGSIDYFGYNMYSSTAAFNPSSYQGGNQAPPADLDDLFYSIAAGSEDLHLEPSGHNALDTGLDLSSSFTTDIDGETRIAPWDIGADEGGVTANFRSIGTNTAVLYQIGDASISAGATVVTFGGGASLPANVGQGDELVIGAETLYILSRDSTTQVTTQTAAAGTHSGAAYTISRAYNDPQSWETARGGDLVGERRCEVGVCYNDGAFTTGVNIRDNTTDGSCYMTLTVAEGQRHNGTAGSGARFDGVVDDDVIELDDPYTVVEWLEVANFSGTAVEGISIGVTGPNSLAQNLLIHDFSGAKHAVVVYPVATLRNSIIYNGPEGVRITNGSADATLENLTIWNVTDDCVDLDSGNSLTLRNCILLGAGDNDLELDGTVNYLGYTMYSSWSGQDPEGFDGNNQSPPADLDDLFYTIAASSENLHLEDSGHNAVDTGADLSGSFTADIDGETRSAPWDLGADEVEALPLRLSSAANQTFTVGAPKTNISAITVTDHGL
ncbi:MAG: right-handed parallel beta-helix repeat-containing protein, partial [Planctomycetota bacterium]